MSNLYRYMDTVGDGSGLKNHNLDYSISEGEAIIAPPVDEIYSLERVIVSIQDAAGMSASDYGNISSGLTNGITMQVDNGVDVINSITDDVSIKTNSEWGMLCYDVDVKTWSSGPELMLVRFTLSKAGSPIKLWGSNNHRMAIKLNDDLSSIEGHRFMVQGTKRKI